MKSKRIYELQMKRDRAGLTPAEKRELKEIERLGDQLEEDYGGNGRGRPQSPNVERIRQRAIGRDLAKQSIETMKHKIEGLTIETKAAFCETIREYLDTVPPTPENKLRPMTDLEADQFSWRLMDFGKFKGDPIGQIPLKYLDWLVGQTDDFKRLLAGYLKNEQIAARLAAELGE